MNTLNGLIPCIISGGSGTRLWPVSRQNMPKPFMRMRDGQSLLQKTFQRAAKLPGVESVLTVTNRDLLFRTLDDYRLVNKAHLPWTCCWSRSVATPRRRSPWRRCMCKNISGVRRSCW